MRRSIIPVICLGIAAIGGCQSARRTAGFTAKFMAVGLWNGIFDDDVALEYKRDDRSWRVSDDEELDSDISWSESPEYSGSR